MAQILNIGENNQKTSIAIFRMQMQKQLKIKSPASMAAANAAALRIQLQHELQNKKQCAYKPYECTQFTLDGYNYCLRHILEDKNAPYKQCSFVYTASGKRCYMPAPKSDKKYFGFSNYCNEHALKPYLTRVRQGTKHPPPQTAEVLLHSLSHYVRKPHTRTISSGTQYSDDSDRQTPDEGEVKVTKSLDPYLDIEATTINASCSNVLDMCSESESDIEPSTYATVWHDAQADSSDNESIDSDQEDVLKHANVYTAEEITLVTRDKLIRLQSLYIEQYKHLQHTLRECKRKYLQALKREKETYCSIHNQVRDRAKEQRLYKKLKAYNQYHKKHGVEAILNKRLHELRMKITEGMVQKQHTYTKCVYVEEGVKCGERALPVARHCRKHIIEDSNQVLFRACGKMRADIECRTPVEAIFDDSTCRLHMDIPTIRSYNHVRKDSESDYDDSIESRVKVKTEIEVKQEPADIFPGQIKDEVNILDPPFPAEIPKLEIKEKDVSLDGFENHYHHTFESMDDAAVLDEPLKEQQSFDFQDDLKEDSSDIDLDLHISDDDSVDSSVAKGASGNLNNSEANEKPV